MTSSSTTPSWVPVVTALFAAIGGMFAGVGTPLGEYFTGKTVKADVHEAAQKSQKDAIQARIAAETEIASLRSEFDALKANLAETATDRDKFKRIFEENNRPPQVGRLSMGGSYTFAGTDLKLQLVEVGGSAGILSATVVYDGIEYRVRPDPNGTSATIVTKGNRNCDVSAQSVTDEDAVLEVDCKATQ